MANLNYQINKEELEESIEAVPAGDYIAIIEESDYKENKSGTGRMLSLQYQIVDGPCKGRKLFNNLNIEHVNNQAQQIARKALNSIGVATGIENIQDSAQLHNIPIQISVAIKESVQYGRQNVIKKHSPVPTNTIAIGSNFSKNATNNTQDQAQLSQPQAQAQQVTGKHPWEK